MKFRRARTIDATDRTLVMGIVNVTPDSFSDAGVHSDAGSAVKAGLAMLDAGADILDVGGESTRPGAAPVDAAEELRRVIPVIRGLREAVDAPLSVDTMKTVVVREALDAGVDIINDVTALRQKKGGEWIDNDDMARVLASEEARVVLMHMAGEPATMQDKPHYEDVVGETADFLLGRAAYARSMGIAGELIWLDPGFGFGKTLAHNSRLLLNLTTVADLGYEVLVGLSRKSMVGAAIGLPVRERLEASLAMAVMAVERGAGIVRVHDVPETVRAVGMADAILRHRQKA